MERTIYLLSSKEQIEMVSYIIENQVQQKQYKDKASIC
jgi:hypothetical protein